MRKRKEEYRHDDNEYLREKIERLQPSKFKRFMFNIASWWWRLEHSYMNCPCCGWEPCDDAGDSESVVYGATSHGYEGQTYWTETWTCECCGEVFEIDNGT